MVHQVNFSGSADNVSIRSIQGKAYFATISMLAWLFVRECFAVKLLTVLLFSNHPKPSTDLRKHCLTFVNIKVISVIMKISFHKKSLESPILWQRADDLSLC